MLHTADGLQRRMQVRVSRAGS